ncbi:MAG: winged helix-turn-helix domain-containing protein [Rhodanobacteraceae bacterium]
MSAVRAEMIPDVPAAETAFCFGPYRLHATARTLEKHGVPIDIGSRALDILVVLVERAGKVVSHREIMMRAWRGLVVDGSNLRVNIMKLRKALDDSQVYILNVPGQGYSFGAPVRRVIDAANDVSWIAYEIAAALDRAGLPRNALLALIECLRGAHLTLAAGPREPAIDGRLALRDDRDRPSPLGNRVGGGVQDACSVAPTAS